MSFLRSLLRERQTWHLADFPARLVVLAEAVVVHLLLERRVLVGKVHYPIFGIGPVSLIHYTVLVHIWGWRERDFVAYRALFRDDVLELNLLLLVFARHCGCDIEIELYVVFTGRL